MFKPIKTLFFPELCYEHLPNLYQINIKVNYFKRYFVTLVHSDISTAITNDETGLKEDFAAELEAQGQEVLNILQVELEQNMSTNTGKKLLNILSFICFS